MSVYMDIHWVGPDSFTKPGPYQETNISFMISGIKWYLSHVLPEYQPREGNTCRK